MDEPLSNLDAKLRVADAPRSPRCTAARHTTIYVTHDQVEAMTMVSGCRAAGRPAHAVHTPRNLYERPANAFVAGFIGSPGMNLKTVPLTEEGAKLGDYAVPLPREIMTAAREADVSEVTLGVRPESLRWSLGEDGLKLTVELVEELGADAYMYGSADLGSGRSGSSPASTPAPRRMSPRCRDGDRDPGGAARLPPANRRALNPA
jgi:multiple sugar transport system ATP-binding protein